MSSDMRRSILDLHPIINGRFSPRAFSSRPISDDDLELLFEAARWAPSSMNEQPWRFLVVKKGGEGYDALFASLTPSNQIWVQRAPVLVLNMVHRTLSRNGKENHHARHDLGAAIMQLTMQATALGLGVHQLGGFHPDQAREAFNIPEELDLVSIIAIGHPGDPSELTNDLQQRESRRTERKPLSELVSFGRYAG